MPSAWNTLLGSLPSRPGVSSSLASVLGKAGTIFHLETSMVFIPLMGNLEDIEDPGCWWICRVAG